jgi:hypothetical protein
MSLSFVLDAVVSSMIYETTHAFAAPFNLSVGAAFDAYITDTFDLLFVACVRILGSLVLLRLTLTMGLVASGNEDTLPHKMSESALAQEENSQKLRILLISVIFLGGTACSVYTGIKCIVFDFEAVIGDESMIAPFLAVSIFAINFQFVAIKKLVESYVIEQGVVLSPLHVHQLKYYPKGPPGRRRRKQCDICREGVHIKPAYNCKDCTFNLCITCFETKSGELQGDEEENVVRGDKGRKEKTVINTTQYFKVRLQLQATDKP